MLTGANGKFCAGADLQGDAASRRAARDRVEPDGDGPVGPTRMLLAKPVIAAVEGHAVAGGLELAAWCDLRVAAEDAVFGVYCRRWGIPLMDGGTIRLARLIGHSHALDLILTGRGVAGEEALRMGLANRLVPTGRGARSGARARRRDRVAPQAALRSDRLSSYEQWSLTLAEALANEYHHGMATLADRRAVLGARALRVGRVARGALNLRDLPDGRGDARRGTGAGRYAPAGCSRNDRTWPAIVWR